MTDFLSQEEVNALLQGGYDMTKAQINRLEFLEKQNAELQAKLKAAEQDATMLQFLEANATQQADQFGPVFRMEIRRKSESTLFNFRAAVIATMRGS